MKSEKKSEKPRKRKKKRIVWLALPLLVAAAAFCIFALLPKTSLTDGWNYLEKQASVDAVSIEADIWNQKKEELFATDSSGDSQYMELLASSAFLGDSRFTDLANFGIIPSSQVYGKYSEDVWYISGYESSLAAAQPRYLFVCYGVNDLARGNGEDLGENGPGFASLLGKYLLEIQDLCPQTTICVNSLIEPRPDIYEIQPKFLEFPQYNEELKKMCEQNGFVYVDNSSLPQGEGHEDVYRDDGTHFIASFYDGWLENMAIYAAGLNYSADA